MGQPGCSMPLLEGVALPHPPAGGGVGQPGCPTLLLEDCVLTLLRVGVWGNLVPPCSR